MFDRRKESHACERHYRVSKWWLYFHFCLNYHFKNCRWRSHNTCVLRFSETSRESIVCVSVNSLAWHNVAHPRSWLGSSCPLLANTDRWCLSEGSAISCHASGAGQKATETINDKPIRVTSFNYVRRLNQSESCSLSHTLLSVTFPPTGDQCRCLIWTHSYFYNRNGDDKNQLWSQQKQVLPIYFLKGN